MDINAKAVAYLAIFQQINADIAAEGMESEVPFEPENAGYYADQIFEIEDGQMSEAHCESIAKAMIDMAD